MKRALCILALVFVASVGCQYRHNMASSSCRSCGPAGAGSLAAARASAQADRVPQIPRHMSAQMQPTGPATGAMAYPYYTTRAPRDFLSANPGTIGP